MNYTYSLFAHFRHLWRGILPIFTGIVISLTNVCAQDEPTTFHASLCDSTQATIAGSHRFATVKGWCGYLPTSIHTQATVVPTVHQQPAGSFSFWFSPLEDLDFYPDKPMGSTPPPHYFPLLSDVPPTQPLAEVSYGLYWTAGYPQFLGKFKAGSVWGIMDYGLAPFVYAEHLPLRRGNWYHVTLTWDKPKQQLRLYVNGVRMGFLDQAGNFDPVPDTLFVGNPMMVMRDLTFTSEVPTEDEVRDFYQNNRPKQNELADEDIAKAVFVYEKPPLNLKRDSSWQETYTCDFTKPEDVDTWLFQSGDKFRDKFELQTSDEGLLIRTPDIIDTESRMYLWSPRTFSGDLWLEFDFQVVSDQGLALVAICASGPRGEDFTQDYGITKTGSMQFMLDDIRDYHWEFMRRVEVMRTDVETQYVAKNPWHWRMHYSVFPRLEQNQWHRLRLVKIGNRLHGSINGETIFDVEDDASLNNGPVLSLGRIGIRQMYNTAMRYRNLVVYSKP
ncbi:DUF1961 family protein [Tunicatimonas pelagia]|uniref:DUF1961 family protein n=1 Tax=Tunicatimonas pelagia TaxID=931531 RepID=UPI00266651F1|nr:DUF1961 family protein [Tunicatimonas pelagia]WKN44955.1 DUF1961 family protein [Tunicatimonas pelagia]